MFKTTRGLGVACCTAFVIAAFAATASQKVYSDRIPGGEVSNVLDLAGCGITVALPVGEVPRTEVGSFEGRHCTSYPFFSKDTEFLSGKGDREPSIADEDAFHRWEHSIRPPVWRIISVDPPG